LTDSLQCRGEHEPKENRAATVRERHGKRANRVSHRFLTVAARFVPVAARFVLVVARFASNRWRKTRCTLIYSREAHGSIDDVARRLEEAAAGEKFGILGFHDLKQKMNQKGVKFRSECRVFDVCNPQRARTVLEVDMAVSTALPCRISVYEEGGTVKVSTLTGPVSAPGTPLPGD